MGPSSRNSFASLTKSSAASPSSPENRRSLWGLKLYSVGGAGAWPGLSPAFMVKIGLCCCLCKDRSRVSCGSADPDRSAKVVMEWSGQRTVTHAAELVKNGDHSRRMAAIRFYLLSRRQFSAHPKSSLARIDKRTARAARNTRYRYSKNGPLDHKMADNSVSLARTNTVSSTITKPIKT